MSKIQTFEQFACNKLVSSREMLQWTLENLHPTKYIHLSEEYADYVLKAKLESITKPQIENLKAQMQGRELNVYQKADALIEFNKLLNYVSKLEQKLLKDE